VWQRRCLRPGLAAKQLVVELNPRNLTSWLLLVVRRALGRPVVGWGHAHSRSGPAPEWNRLRRLMQRLCSALVSYTRSEAQSLGALFPGKPVWAASNSLYSRRQLSGALPTNPAQPRTDLVMIGRLVPEKKPVLGLRAFASVVGELPPEVTLHIVGGGPLAAEIERFVAASGLCDRVRLHGYAWDWETITPIFRSCRAMLSPGYIGLNAIQALAFGVFVIYGRDEPHAPEIEALDETNSAPFESDDVATCARRIMELYDGSRRVDPVAIARASQQMYNTDEMSAVFARLVRVD
jgi:glycosyltransferase involved in cell wall biosynthesis